MTEGLTAILACNDYANTISLKEKLSNLGYIVIVSNNYQELETYAIEVSEGKRDNVLFIMDLNYEYPATSNITNSEQIYNFVNGKGNNSAFLGFSSNSRPIEPAREKKMPYCHSDSLNRLDFNFSKPSELYEKNPDLIKSKYD